jgi:DNA-binding response OmpR family regulator
MAKILIVDDDRATTGLLKTVFEMQRFKVVACPDPKRVIQVMHKEKPDLIFLDFHLAETVSLPVLREIKADPVLKHTAVIMTSGLDRSAECLEAGADRFVIKPFRPMALIDEIKALLEQADVQAICGTSASRDE